jgi:hypothetical protein
MFTSMSSADPPRLAVRLPANIRPIRRYTLAQDAHTTLTLLHAQVGDPTWDWHKLLVHAAPAPACAADSPPAYAADSLLCARFRTTLERWMRVQHPHILQILDVADDDPPYALLEYAHGPTLADLCSELSATRCPLSGPIAGLLISQLEEAHRALAAAGTPHGFWSAHITITDSGLKLAPTAWWDARATAATDRHHLETLSAALLAYTFDGVRCPPEHEVRSSDLWSLALSLCGEPKPALEPV